MNCLVFCLLLVLLGGHVVVLVFSHVTCELKQIQQCTNDLWWTIRGKATKDVQEQLTDGCTFWQVYEDCLATDISRHNETDLCYLAPLDVHVEDDGNMTIGQGNEKAKVKTVTFKTSLPITDGKYLISKKDDGKETNKEKKQNQKQKIRKKQEETEAVPQREFSTPSIWKYIILETGVFFSKISLCDALNNTALKNVTSISEIVEYRDGVDLVKAEESKCYKSYQCFTDLLTSVADEASTHPCDVLKTFISCQESSNEKCTEKASLYYVDAIKSIWLPLLEEFGKIPEFCDSFAKNLTQTAE